MRAITDRLTEAVHDLFTRSLPGDVVAHAKHLIIDTLLGAYAASGRTVNRALSDVYTRMGGAAEASLWSPHQASTRLPLAHAAFVNTLYASALDFDSLNGKVHADAVCLPVAWGVAERAGRSGRDLLQATIVASEITARLARAHPGMSAGWSATSVYGVAGAATAASLLGRLDQDRTRHALGLAFAQSAGTQQANVERTLTKRLQPAFAARNGIVSSLLAEAGASAPKGALEGKFGFYTLYEAGDPETIFAGLGSEFQFLDTSIKRFPVCACSHAALLACEKLVQTHRPCIDDIAGLSVTISPFMDRLVGGDFTSQGDPEVVGQFSLRYALAIMLEEGRVGLDALEIERIQSPTIARRAGAIEIRVEPTWRGELAPSIVEVRMRDGSVLAQRCDALPGDAGSPHAASALREKWRDCIAPIFEMSDGPASAHGVERDVDDRLSTFIASIEDLDHCNDVDALSQRLMQSFVT